MTTLVIRDLEHSVELDQVARELVCGGYGMNLFQFDQLFSGIDHGNLTSNVNVNAAASMFSPTVITNLALYLPISTVIQLDMDNILNANTTFSTGQPGAPVPA